MLAGAPFTTDEVAQAAQPALFVPESMTTIRLLEKFRQVRQELALIVDEYGDLQGLVTLTDVLKAIIGELHMPQTPEEDSMIQREDGSWLVDGSLSLQRFQVGLQLPDDWIGDSDGEFHTLGGFVMSILGRIPQAADHFTRNGLRFEVVDMDGHRVDKILVSAPPASESIEEDGSPPLW